MNSQQHTDVTFFRCPSCGTENLIASSEYGVYAQCTKCLEQFGLIETFPFLVRRDFLSVIGEANDVCIQAEDLDAMAADVVKQANIKFHNAIAEEYEHDVSTFDIFRPGGACQQRLKETLKEASKTSGGDVMLDVCCGTGNVLLAGKDEFVNCIGIDISVNMMKIAAYRDLEVIGADATNIPFPDGSVNCVTAFSALHHLVDYPVVVAEMARSLKPGGTFYTDWDPNGHVTHTGWAVSLMVNSVHFVRRLISRSQIPESAEQRVAEYHHNSESGFDAEKAADVLRAEKFSKVEVIYHLNPPSFRKAGGWSSVIAIMAAFKIISFVPPIPKNLYPWVAIRAIK